MHQQRIIYSNQWSLSTKKWNEPGKINQIYRRHSSKYAIFKLSSDFFCFIHHIMNDYINIWWIFFLEIALNRHHRFLNHVITNDSEYQMDCTEFWHIHYNCIEFWNLISVWWSTTRPFMNHGGKMWDFLDLFLSVFFFPLFFFIVFFLSYKPEWIPTNKFTIQSN